MSVSHVKTDEWTVSEQQVLDALHAMGVLPKLQHALRRPGSPIRDDEELVTVRYGAIGTAPDQCEFVIRRAVQTAESYP